MLNISKQQTHWYYCGSNGQFSYQTYPKTQLWLRWLTCIVLLLAPSCNDYFAYDWSSKSVAGRICKQKYLRWGCIEVRTKTQRHRDVTILDFHKCWSKKKRQHQHKVNVWASFCLGSMPVLLMFHSMCILKVPCALHSAPIHIAAVGSKTMV